MLDFTFYNPTHFVFGKDVEVQTGKHIAALGCSRVTVVYGQSSAIKSGLLQRVLTSLDAEGISHMELGGVLPNPQDDLVYDGIKIARGFNADFLLGIGGASAIDTAKAIAAGVCYTGDFWDMYAGKSQVERCLKLGAVVTIAAAGSESSNSSVITRKETNQKRGLRSALIRPSLAIMNPELTYPLPAIQKAYGAADIMSHIFERYFTNTTGVELTDELCEGVLRAVIKAAPQAIFDSCDYNAHADLLWAGAIAHNDTLSTGREQDWSSHALSHELSSEFGIAHGGALAVLFPCWMRYQMSHDMKRFERFARRVMGVSGCGDSLTIAENGVSRLREFFCSLKLPDNLRFYGVTESDIPRLAANVAYKNNGKAGFFRPLNQDDVEKIYMMALG